MGSTGWTDADAALRECWRLRSELGVRSVDLTGRVAVKLRLRCVWPTCGSRACHARRNGDGSVSYVCARCGHPWEGVIIPVGGGGRRYSGFDASRGVVGWLEGLFERALYPDDLTVWVLHVVVGLSYGDIARVAHRESIDGLDAEGERVERLPQAVLAEVRVRLAGGRAWTEKAVRGAVARCRRAVDEALDDAGLLRRASALEAA